MTQPPAIAMSGEKPDTSRQSEGFKEVQRGLTAGQIAVPRPKLSICGASDQLSDIGARTCDRAFDYLPVQDADEYLIGLLSIQRVGEASHDDGGARVVDRMDPLSEADLIGEDTPIVELIRRIRKKPFLVVSGQEIVGMVAWSDLQRLPVRAALFALVTGFELTMSETIERHFGNGDDWTIHVDESRLSKAKEEYRKRQERGSDVDLLLCTQFCDKRDILIESLDFTIGKRKLEKRFKAIEGIRNDLAHANNYAMTFEQAQLLRATLQDLGELRTQIHSLAR